MALFSSNKAKIIGAHRLILPEYWLNVKIDAGRQDSLDLLAIGIVLILAGYEVGLTDHAPRSRAAIRRRPR